MTYETLRSAIVYRDPIITLPYGGAADAECYWCGDTCPHVLHYPDCLWMRLKREMEEEYGRG